MSGLVAIGAAKLLPLLARLSVVSVVMYFVTSGLPEKRRRRKLTSEADSRAFDTLWRRYVRGKISWDEYEEMSHDLKEA
jgi:uncharacterized membrane protein